MNARATFGAVPLPELRPLVLGRWLGRYAIRRSGAMTIVLLAMLLKVAVDLVRPWPTKVIIDSALKQNPLPGAIAAVGSHLPGFGTPEGLIAWCVASTMAIFLAGWCLTAALAVASVTFGQTLSYDLAADLFAHIQRLSLGFHRRGSTGDAIRRVLVDSNCMSIIIKDALIPVLSSLVMLAAMFAILWRLDALLAAVSLSVIPMMAWVFWRYAGPLTQTSYVQQRADVRMYETVERSLIAIPTIQAFCREDETLREFRAATSNTFSATLVAIDVQLMFKIFAGLTTALGTAGIVWVGAYEVLAGTLTTGELLVILAYLVSLYAPLATLAFTSSTVQGAASSAQRVLEVWETRAEPKDKAGAISLAHVRGDVTFEQVTVGYDEAAKVLHDVTFHAAAGHTIAIVGPTGAGKSTLVSLIPRFLDPWSGRVLLDEHDLRDLSIATVRRSVSLVLQDPFLFPISIVRNIAYGRPEASAAEIEAAAKAANAHDFIMRLPEGYDTLVGERGATLSGGERQRLSIARALLKDAPILILDEPTASLDVLTESSMLEALGRLTAGRTTIVIAHRLSTVRNADLILVVQDGRIVESGRHDELLAVQGVYASLHARQFAGRAEPAKRSAPEGRPR
jgi:ABC-type multidrug transport system fused ATPase/permease subunit